MKKWRKLQLGDIAVISYGYTAKASVENIGLKFLRITDIQNDMVNWSSVPYCQITEDDFQKYKLIDQDIVFARTGATTGKSYLVCDPPEAVAASYLIRLRVQDPTVSPQFISKYFQTSEYWNNISSGISGSAQGGFNASKLSALAVKIPPLPEQKRIVSILDEAFEGIDRAIANTEKNLANSRELFESYLNAIFTQKGDGWVENKLHSLVEPSCSLSYGIVQPGNDYESGLPIVRPTDLTTKTINVNSLKRINPLLADSYKRTKLSGGELLLCVRGNTGKVGIGADELKGANVTRGIVPIRFEESIVVQAFGYYMLISKMTQEQIKEKTYGTALMQINIRDLKNIVLSFPKQEEQQILVEKLDQVEKETQRLETIYSQKITALKELKQSILKKAFTGELTADNANQVKKTAKEVNAA